MSMPATENANSCPTTEISAYIDGELSPSEERQVEKHLTGCSDCTDRLNQQKNFLFALSASLESEKEFELPENFTKTIVANAESRVSGLRRPGERFTAVFICAALLLFALFALGADVPMVFSAFGSVFEKLIAVGSFILHSIFNISLSTTVVVRSLFSQIAFSSVVMLSLAVVFFGIVLMFFSHFIFRGSRAREN